MKIDIITIFPELYTSVFSASLIKKAIDKKICSITVHNLRDYCEDKHKQVDDTSFGGGPGMVFKPEPLHRAINALKGDGPTPAMTLLTCPRGEPLNQQLVNALSAQKHLIIIAAHYEGIDERITDTLVDKSVSVGDFVLCGGELPSMMICEAVVRMLPGVVGKQESLAQDSFQNGLLDYPHYTKPANYLQMVPPVLLSGSHKAINKWRRQQSLIRTFNNRPDLLSIASLTVEDRQLLTDYLQPEAKKGDKK